MSVPSRSALGDGVYRKTRKSDILNTRGTHNAPAADGTAKVRHDRISALAHAANVDDMLFGHLCELSASVASACTHAVGDYETHRAHAQAVDAYCNVGRALAPDVGTYET